MLVNRVFKPIDVDAIPEKYGIYQKVANFDADFRSSPIAPIVVNDYDVSTLERKAELRNLLVTTHTGVHLPLLPRCDCSDGLEGYQYLGHECNVCGVVVTPATERDIVSNVWIATPEGVDKLINPLFWTLLDNALTTRAGKNQVTGVLEWMTDPLSRVARTDQLVFDIIKNHVYRDGTPFKRGLNMFYRYFNENIDLLLNKVGLIKQAHVRDNLLQFISTYADCLFCNHIPIPNKLTAVVETANGVSFSQEHATKNSYDAALSIATIYSSPEEPSQSKKEHHCVSAISTLSQYYTLQISSHLSKKTGWNRKHGVGSRQDFSFRCVISSITGPHNHEEIWLPWSLAVKLFSVHIMSVLMRRGVNPIAAERKIQHAGANYDPDIDEILKDYIRDSPDLGPAVLVQRNPTLSKQSAQTLQVTKIKTDISDVTLSLSVLVLVGFNADMTV